MALLSVTTVLRDSQAYANTILINTNRILRWKANGSGTEFEYQKTKDPIGKVFRYTTATSPAAFRAAVKKALVDYRTVQEIFLKLPVKAERMHGFEVAYTYTGTDVAANYPHHYLNADEIVFAKDIDATTCYIFLDSFGFGRIRFKAIATIATLTASESQSTSL
jgi:hypothetical protein